MSRCLARGEDAYLIPPHRTRHYSILCRTLLPVWEAGAPVAVLHPGLGMFRHQVEEGEEGMVKGGRR